jgi:hypothetical protein
VRRPSAPGQSGLVRRLTSIAADRKSPHDGGAFHLQEFRSSTPWLARGLLGRAETANSPPRRWREQVAKFFVRDVSGNGRGLNRHALLRSLRAQPRRFRQQDAGCFLDRERAGLDAQSKPRFICNTLNACGSISSRSVIRMSGASGGRTFRSTS